MAESRSWEPGHPWVLGELSPSAGTETDTHSPSPVHGLEPPPCRLLPAWILHSWAPKGPCLPLPAPSLASHARINPIPLHQREQLSRRS